MVKDIRFGGKLMIEIPNQQCFQTKCCDGAQGMMEIKKNSAKLVYGSPPYPNAVRNYGVWKNEDYIKKISPFIDGALQCLSEDGFLVINVKANREKINNKSSSRRSLVIERLAIKLEEEWGLHCVDIEIWVKGNPVPTGLRSACQDAYEQILWFSVSPKWTLNIDSIRRPYTSHSIETYNDYEFKPRANGLPYVSSNRRIEPNPLGALPNNIIQCGVSNISNGHQAVQPIQLPIKYIKATTNIGDLVVDPWMGSGTTGVAALELERKFIGFDVFQEYVSLSNERMLEVENRLYTFNN